MIHHFRMPRLERFMTLHYSGDDTMSGALEILEYSGVKDENSAFRKYVHTYVGSPRCFN